MKMSSQMVERTLSQFEAQPVPDDHPAVTQLNRLFGEPSSSMAVGWSSSSRPSQAKAARNPAWW
jgi:hypothetical protein